MNQTLRTFYNSYKEFHEIEISSEEPYFELLSLCQSLSKINIFWLDVPSDLMERTRCVDTYKIEDTEILGLFYFMQARALYFCQKMSLATNLLLKGIDLLNNKKHRVLKAKMFTFLGFYSSNEKETLSYFQQAKKLITFEFKIEVILYCNMLIKFAFAGKLEKLKDDLILIASTCDSPFILELLNEYKFIDAVERGDQVMATAFLKDIKLEGRKKIYVYMVVLHLIKDEWDSNQWKDIPEEVIQTGIHLPFTELKNGNPQKSLYEIKQLISMENPEFLDFLLRAELADKNLIAAEHLMIKKKSIKEMKYLDDLFLARIALLKKDFELAAFHFHKSRSESISLNSLGMFEFELNLAIEVSLGDLKQICQLKPTLSKRLKAKEPALKLEKRYGVDEIIGDSSSIKEIRSLITQFSSSDALVLITGETGTGKEVVAKVLHAESVRSKKKMLTINCGAISDSLLQSELFGHEKGAFTGAVRSHKGIFEEAGDGVVFLDEIGEISMQVQIALLRVLETNEIRPVGSAKAKPVYCRILAATNAPLENLVELGTFRRDLFYRLNRLKINIPPLRDRREDIVPLVMYFLNLNRQEKTGASFSEELKRAFVAFDWSGNVRELKSEIEKLRFLNSEKEFYEISDWNKNDSGEAKSTSTSTFFNDSSNEIEVSNQTIEIVLKKNVSPSTRIDVIKALFIKHKRLTAIEISKSLDVKPRTISNDLKKLIELDLIERVCPSSARRTFYFTSKHSKKGS